MRLVLPAVILSSIVLSSAALGAETRLKLESLPAAVQAAIKEHMKDTTISGITSEKEKGKITYEVEGKLNGKAHNLAFDQSGAIVEMEDEIDLDSVPAAARSAIQKRVDGGAITMVEKVTMGSVVSYEATIKGKNGKSVEYAFNADGSRRKGD